VQLAAGAEARHNERIGRTRLAHCENRPSWYLPLAPGSTLKKPPADAEFKSSGIGGAFDPSIIR
jgi:hypothetical protein